MGQYYLACGVAIIIQYLVTTILAEFIHYLIANMAAIVISAVFVYIINDIWTFNPLQAQRWPSSLKNMKKRRNI